MTAWQLLLMEENFPSTIISVDFRGLSDEGSSCSWGRMVACVSLTMHFEVQNISVTMKKTSWVRKGIFEISNAKLDEVFILWIQMCLAYMDKSSYQSDHIFYTPTWSLPVGHKWSDSSKGVTNNSQRNAFLIISFLSTKCKTSIPLTPVNPKSCCIKNTSSNFTYYLCKAYW